MAKLSIEADLPDDVPLDSRVRVPNKLPTIHTMPYRIAIIGEAPGADEEKQGEPFVGASGRMLSAFMNSANIIRAACFVGNICQIRPPNNDISVFDFHGPEIEEGLDKLREELRSFRPNVILLLGRTALRAAMGEASIESWRGTVFKCEDMNSPFFGFKCVASYHPAFVLRVYEKAPLLRFDLNRVLEEGKSPDLVLPNRSFDINLSSWQTVEKLEAINRGDYGKVWVSFDIEGYVDRLTHCSISTEWSSGFIIAFDCGQWSLEEECAVWIALSRLLMNPDLPKVLQNSLYDAFVLAYTYRIVIRNIAWDTMIGHWEIYCEMEKNLALQASIYTREPFYKEDRTHDNRDRRYRYCCLDSAVTGEIMDVQRKELATDPDALTHAKFLMDLLRPLLYMELQGFNYDSEAAHIALKKVYEQLYELQHELNRQGGVALPDDSTPDYILGLARLEHGLVRQRNFINSFESLVANCRKDAAEACGDLLTWWNERGGSTEPLTKAELGRCSIALEKHLNVDSNKQMCAFLYDQKRYPKQYKTDKKTGRETITADVNALLTLYTKTQDEVMRLILKIRSLLYQVEVLSIRCDPDGRVRCGYNIVGTETGRLSCSESPTRSGYNLQTVTKKLRYLFKADDGYDLFQCDLAGADGWTVAAHCARLGDSTMIDDYRFGLKPAKILVLMYEHGADAINKLSRPELKELSETVDGDSWLYFGFKVVQHGTNYKMGQNTMSSNILKQSYKIKGDPIYIPPKDCGAMQRTYLMRYRGIELWHGWVEQQLLRYGKMKDASGHTRIFFGRIRDGVKCNHQTLMAALANEPQVNTTYANNLALHKLWNDPENHDERGRLIIRPIHHVHDAIIGQWPKDVREWAVQKMRSYYDNPLTIAGQRIVIPFEGAYGTSWGDLKIGKI